MNELPIQAPGVTQGKLYARLRSGYDAEALHREDGAAEEPGRDNTVALLLCVLVGLGGLGALYALPKYQGTIGAVACALLVFSALAAMVQARRRGRADRAVLKARTKLTEAIEALPEGFALYDSDERLTLTNTSLRRLLPEFEAQLRIGAHYTELIRHGATQGLFPDASGQIEDWIEARLASHALPYRSFIQPLSNGSWVRIAERRTHDGGLVAIVSDITDLKTREIALSEAKEAAEAANHAKTEFLANMSHELRTPLNAIIGFSEIMDGQMFGPLGNEQYVEYAREIHGSGQHLLGVIADILDVSRIEAGEFELEEGEVRLAPLVVEASGMFARLARDKNIAMNGGVEPEDLALRADRRALQQVLINLISNAVKFTEPGGKVSIGAGRLDDGRVHVTVADTGIGVATADIARIFEPFGQVESAFARSNGGTGLGLSLSNAFVELHGGQLNFQSELGQGTKVSVLLPAERVLAAPAAVSQTA